MAAVSPLWHLYVIDCDGRLYTGISTDPIRRLHEHRSGGRRSARFTRGARKLDLLWHLPVGDRALAQRAEYRLRRLQRADKLSVIRRASCWAKLEDMLFP
ncbi:MAG: GIY-YIG nuclease family protein [Gammaproteobacteria bacterium]|nr:GIY-YIG nuclease family protein [Gammaproteobacteria bacterium]